MTDEAKQEAINLADRLIGPEVEVRKYLADPMDEELTENPADVAVRNFQRRQRLMLAEYQNPDTTKVIELESTINEELSEHER